MRLRQTKRTWLAPLLCAIFLTGAVPQVNHPSQSSQEFQRRLVAAAIERTHHSVRYVSAYVRIPYPGGDVPADTGVCTDEIIRSYRAVGVDLQKEVHEDVLQNFAAYPNKKRWLLAHPDSNIDHRRVPTVKGRRWKTGFSIGRSPATTATSGLVPANRQDLNALVAIPGWPWGLRF